MRRERIGQGNRRRRGALLTRVALLPWVGAALVLALLLGADTDAGRGLLTRGLTAASGGRVLVQGLGGELPFRPRIERLALADATGVWLTAGDVALVLRPAALLRGELDIRALTIDRLDLSRLPEAGAGGGTRLRLPGPVRLRQLVIAQLAAPALAERLPPFTVTGRAEVAGAEADAELLLTVPGRGDRYRLALAPAPPGHRLTLAVSEAPDGPLATLARARAVPLPPDLAHWTLDAAVQGPPSAAAVQARLAAGAYRLGLDGVLDLPARRISALAVELDVAGMAVAPAGMRDAVRWESISARAALSGPFSAPQGRVRASARGLALHHPAAAPAPLAAGALRLDGHFDLAGAPRLEATLTATPTAAPEPWRGLLGGDPRLSLTLARAGSDWALEQARLDAALADLTLAGRLGRERLDLTWTLGLAAPALLGADAGARLDARGRLSGSPGSPLLAAELELRGTGARPAGPVRGTLQLEPLRPRGRLALDGRWLGEPAAMDLALDAMPDGGLELRVADGRWSGMRLTGLLRRAPGARLPAGALDLRIARLETAAPLLAARLPGAGAAWVGQIGGRLEARLELAADERLRLRADATELRLPHGVRAGRLALDAALSEPFGRAEGRVQLRLSDVGAAQLRGDLDIVAQGLPGAWDIEADARLGAVHSGHAGLAAASDARLSAAGRLDLPARRLELRRLQGAARKRRVTLLAPAVVDFGAGVTLDALRLGLSAGPDAGNSQRGVLALSGRLAPRLAVDARLQALALAAVAPWLPPLPAELGTLTGTLDAEARIDGRLAAPTGRLDLRAAGIEAGGAAALGLPPAQGRLTLTLDGGATRLAAEAWMGEGTKLALDGRIGAAPWSAPAPLALRGRGQLDLALLDAWLGAAGRRAAGRLALNIGIGGTRAAPRLDGALRIAEGAWRDRRLGLWLDGIDGAARLGRDGLRIERLAANAGAGTLTLTGDLDWRTPGQPVALRLRARDAEPIRQDLLRLRGDADLALTGDLTGALRLAGTLRFAEIELRIPERLPADIPTLDVVEIGARRQPRPTRRAPAGGGVAGRLALDVGIDAPRGVLVRGRNIDAELGGSVRVTGSAAAPAAAGGFTLQRGEIRLLGQPLRFSRGRIGLDGADLLDPTLELEARAQSPGATAILAVEGRARAPQVVLRGEPPMSDDEVLSRLLFGVPPARLSAFQLARIGLAAASVAGVGIDAPELLDRARARLGLPRLRMGRDRRGDAVVEGGAEVGERVYLGARQGVGGGEPRAVLGLQVAPRLRFESDVGARGAGAGAAFELEY